jgi:hypothetical protein
MRGDECDTRYFCDLKPHPEGSCMLRCDCKCMSKRNSKCIFQLESRCPGCGNVIYSRASIKVVTEFRRSRVKCQMSDLFIVLRRPGGQMKAWDFSVG